MQPCKKCRFSCTMPNRPLAPHTAMPSSRKYTLRHRLPSMPTDGARLIPARGCAKSCVATRNALHPTFKEFVSLLFSHLALATETLYHPNFFRSLPRLRSKTGCCSKSSPSSSARRGANEQNCKVGDRPKVVVQQTMMCNPRADERMYGCAIHILLIGVHICPSFVSRFQHPCIAQTLPVNNRVSTRPPSNVQRPPFL